MLLNDSCHSLEIYFIGTMTMTDWFLFYGQAFLHGVTVTDSSQLALESLTIFSSH